MKTTWAWAWLAALALLGWVPGLLLSYFVGLALAIVTGWRGPGWVGVFYVGLLGFGLLLLMQVRKHFGLAGAEREWFTWAGGGALTLIWISAYVGVGHWVGML